MCVLHHRPIKESFFDDDLWNSMEVYEFHGFQGSHGNPWMTWNFMDAMEFHGIHGGAAEEDEEKKSAHLLSTMILLFFSVFLNERAF